MAGAETLHLIGMSNTATSGAPKPNPDVLPGEWWKDVPPGQRDWWTNRLNQMPYANTERFRDNNALLPSISGAGGDRINAGDQAVTQDYFNDVDARIERSRRRIPRY